MSPGDAIKIMLTTSDNMICLHACLRDIMGKYIMDPIDASTDTNHARYFIGSG